MTEQEAIKDITRQLLEIESEDADVTISTKSLRMGIKALEKQIAKKPIWNTSEFVNRHHCPSCDGIVWVEQPHCGYCGQKLDWGE